MRLRTGLFFLGTLLGAACIPFVMGAEKPISRLPGVQADGSILLPNQWSLRPMGRQLLVGDFPVNIALHPDGRYAAVLHSGYGQHEVRVIDVIEGRPISQVAIDETFYGLTWSPKGKELYVSGSAAEVVYAFHFADGYLSERRELRVRPQVEQGIPAGIAVDAKGKALYVAENWGQGVVKLDLPEGRVLWSHSLAKWQGQAETLPDGERHEVAQSPDAAFPYSCVPDSRRDRLYVSLWAKSSVLVLEASTGKEITRWPVGDHPNEMQLSSDGRLFVAEANRNSVSVIDTESGRLMETLSSALHPGDLPGSMPNSIALSPDGQLCFVANANNNNVAVFDIQERGRAQSLGFIPVGWFPTSVRVTKDGKTLVVANGKGMKSAANPYGPFPADKRPWNLQSYIAGLLQGSLCLIDLPSTAERAARFASTTAQALACTPVPDAQRPNAVRPPDSPIPATPGAATPLRHVIYLIKENRTYDQIFGDIPEGNGAPHLCLFPESVTPNLHALAREFVLLDNFYADGEISADGHEWSMAAYATDFVEKIWPLNYGHGNRKKFDYPSEGRYPIAYPANGYLWNRAAEAGISYRSFGEFCHRDSDKDALTKPSIPVLAGHIDPQYPPFDLHIPDVERVDRFIAELARYEAAGEMPLLQVVQLPGDHTEGTKHGRRTPTAMVADNDLAVGRLVEALSRSRFWRDTAIFILEDDAQNGPDHVDAHRIPALVISPYTRRHIVDSTLYSTTSMLRTIELILGLQPMSQFDAVAAPMFSSFQATPDFSPFTARPAQVDLKATNLATAWGARASQRMDFSVPDRVDDLVLNEIIWHSVKGDKQRMPGPVRAAFFKAHPKRDDDGD